MLRILYIITCAIIPDNPISPGFHNILSHKYIFKNKSDNI